MGRDKVAIIGAGLSGLHLANRLALNFDVTVFEKSRGLGGRMASKRTDFGYFDHGAQYFSAKSPEFKAFLEPFLNNNVISQWQPSMGVMNASGDLNKSEKEQIIYIPNPRMTGLAKSMSHKIDIHHGVQITSVIQANERMVLAQSDNKIQGEFDLIISSAPANQTFEILAIEPDKKVRMSACFTLMLRYDGADQLPYDAIKFDDEILGFMSIQSARRLKEDINSRANIVVQTNNIWADSHLDEPQNDIIDAVKSQFATLMKLDPLKLEVVMLHRWRYAATPEPLNAPFIYLPERKIAACGDWCLGSRVEAAFLSADALADHLLNL